ncbi:MAG: alkaline shock response membrane anchor protein AmaP [Firmicutes bacterium]|nr:alkaline shock response membrane anchor protein AmaP [Bacillota bacterium]
MKVGERLVSLLAGIILAVVGLVLLMLFFGLGQAEVILESLKDLGPQERWWTLGVSGISLLLAFLAIRMALRMKREEKTIIHHTQFGEIRIAVSAVESLSLRACKHIKGVKDAHVGVRADLTGLDVFIEVTVNPDLSIPQISEEIKTKVDDYIFETVGIRVNSVKVLVTRIAAEVRARVE